MVRKMPYKLIMQSDQKRTYFTPTKLFNLKDDPHEDINLLEQPKYRPVSQSLLSEYKYCSIENAQLFQDTYKNQGYYDFTPRKVLSVHG